VGHPTNIYVGKESPPIDQIEGILKCSGLPPTDLYPLVLPYRSRGKLFPICRACADSLNNGDCLHNDDERAITGTWVVHEVRKVIEKGYK